MSNFVSGGGVECGPTSALKDVSSRVDRDYGLQRVRLVYYALSETITDANRTVMLRRKLVPVPGQVL